VTTSFTESIVEEAALWWLGAADWDVKYGADMVPGEPSGERADYGKVILERRLRDAPRPPQCWSASRGLGGRLPQGHTSRGR
jgi:hypothetical protein